MTLTDDLLKFQGKEPTPEPTPKYSAEMHVSKDQWFFTFELRHHGPNGDSTLTVYASADGLRMTHNSADDSPSFPLDELSIGVLSEGLQKAKEFAPQAKAAMLNYYAQRNAIQKDKGW